MFPSSGEGRETPAQLGHSERANLSHRLKLMMKMEKCGIGFFIQFFVLSKVIASVT
jgi:hypothetical protein